MNTTSKTDIDATMDLAVEIKTHAEKMIRIWRDGKVDSSKIGKVISETDKAKHFLERQMIATASCPKDSVPSVSTVDTDGNVVLNLPLNTPSWAKAQELSSARNYERYSKVARRLQKKLLAKGLSREQLGDLKKF